MTTAGWMEIAATLALAIALAVPMGEYLARVWMRQPVWLDALLRPLEAAFHWAAGVDPRTPQTWGAYARSLIMFNMVGFLALFAILELQGLLPFNPEHAPGLPPAIAFGAAVSFITNTDWLPGHGDRMVSELAQSVGLLTQNFLSGGSALAVAAALARAFGASRSKTVGNFWTDLFRVTAYYLLPLSVGLSLVLAALGVPQTLHVDVGAHTLEGARQTLDMGPLASQVAIAEFGTNGSGFFDASAAHPFINPSGLSNLIEAATLYAAGLACLFAFGRATHERRQAITLVAAVTLAIGAVCAVIYFAETAPTPASLAVHAPAAANLEGKEVRFGAPATAAFTAMSNGARDGSLDADLESFTPLGGCAAMSAVLLGGMLPGSAGAGLVSVLLFSLLAVVVGGMVVGRTPEFLGKKVEVRETRLALAALLVVNLSILGFSALASVAPAGLAARSAPGAQGLTEIVYGYMSAVANTGSVFPGLHADGVFWGLTLGAAMALGRYGLLLPAIAVAGSIAAKPKMRPTEGALPTDGPLFVGLLLAVLLLFSGLQYFPVLALGPVEEQLQMNKALSAATASLSPRPSRRTAPF